MSNIFIDVAGLYAGITFRLLTYVVFALPNTTWLENTSPTRYNHGYFHLVGRVIYSSRIWYLQLQRIQSSFSEKSDFPDNSCSMYQ